MESWSCRYPIKTPFYGHLHQHYAEHLDDDKGTLEYLMSDHIRMGGAFWGLATLDILNVLDTRHQESDSRRTQNNESSINRKNAVNWVKSCYDPISGGYGSNVGHDAHLTSTLVSGGGSKCTSNLAIYAPVNALLILSMFDALDEAPRERIAIWVASLQNADGSFCGDKWGESDGRFSYCAVAILTMLGKLDLIDVNGAIQWIKRCLNPDGAFGNVPGAESHAAYVFCCVTSFLCYHLIFGFFIFASALYLLEALDVLDRDLLGRWLAARQLSGRCGGFNGRPEKAPDVCYSWWIFASLKIIGRSHWIDKVSLADFILSSQDTATGGIADRTGDLPDIFHTFFGVAGLSLLDAIIELQSVDPIYALTKRTVQKLALPGAFLES